MSVVHTANKQIDSLDVNSSGQRIVIGLSSLEGNTWDGGLKILSKEGLEVCSKYSPAGISMVRFSGSRLLLAGRDDGVVVMYSSEKLEEMQIFEIHDDIVSCVTDDPHNESQFSSCGWDGNIYIWDWRLHTSKQAPLISYSNGHNGHVNDVKYSPFHRDIFSSVGQDGLLRVWDKRESPSSGCASIINIGQSSSCLSYEASNDTILYVGTDSGDLSVVDPKGTKPVLFNSKLHNGRIRKISPSQTSNEFLCASDDTTYTICTLGAGSITENRRVSCHTDYVTDIVCCSSSVPVKQNIVTDQNEESEREAKLGLKEMDVILSVSSDKTLRRNCLERGKPHEGKKNAKLENIYEI